MTKRMTHIGIIVVTSCFGSYKGTIYLRETKRYFVSINGTKYRKDNGSAAGCGEFHICHLDLSSVRKLEASQ